MTTGFRRPNLALHLPNRGAGNRTATKLPRDSRSRNRSGTARSRRFLRRRCACGRKPPFKPTICVADAPEATLYDPLRRAVVLVPYEVLPPGRREAMERFAKIGTLGFTGCEQYSEVFNNLLVAHELGHWLQEVAQRPLDRWQAEYEANRIMVAFWRTYPAPSPAASTELRLANFVVQAPNTPRLMPDDCGMRIEDYFNTHLAEIESNPLAYAGFQKLMVRQAVAERPVPTFRDVVAAAWPSETPTSDRARTRGS